MSAHRVCVTALELSNGSYLVSPIHTIHTARPLTAPGPRIPIGITLQPGTHVGVPSGWIQRSSESYTNPDAFDGFRFVKRAAAGASNTRLVDLSADYLVFGMGVHAWSVHP